MNNKKKSIIVVVVCVVVAVLVALIVPKKVDFFYNNDVDKIDSVMMMSGNTGEQIYADEDELQMIADYLEGCTFVPNYFKPASYGWNYRFVVKADGKVVDFVFIGDNCSIDNVDYKYKNKSGITLKEIWDKLND